MAMNDKTALPGHGLLRFVTILMIVVLVFGFWTLWRVYEIKDCCDKVYTEVEGETPPGGVPTISVAPRVPESGSPVTTSWRIDLGTGSRDVIFGESGYLRGDVQSEAMKLEGRAGAWTAVLNTATVNLATGDVLVIDGTGSAPGWTWNGAALAPCDFDPTSGIHTCTHDGIPPEFDGELASSAIVLDPTTADPEAGAYVLAK